MCHDRTIDLHCCRVGQTEHTCIGFDEFGGHEAPTAYFAAVRLVLRTCLIDPVGSFSCFDAHSKGHATVIQIFNKHAIYDDQKESYEDDC